MIVTVYDEYIKSNFLTKTCCLFLLEDIRYARVVKSHNYGIDTRAVYIVLSKEPIEGKNLAVSFDPRKQIVIRVTSQNYLKIKQKLTPLHVTIPFSIIEDVFKGSIGNNKQITSDC